MTIPARLYTRVLVLLDGSATAEFAIRFGADLASKHQAELALLHLRRAAPPPADADTDTTAEAEATAYLERARKTAQPYGLANVSTHTFSAANLHEALTKFIDAERVSIVVMSTQGRTNMMRWIFGSGVEQALSHFPVPLLLVRPVYQKIIVPLDGSGWSESAIPRASEIARVHDAELILLHVYQPKGSDYADQWALAGQHQIAAQAYDEVKDRLVSLRNALRQQGLRAREVLIRASNPAQAICEFVESEDGISLVVMSTHGRTGLARWLMGSVAQKVIQNGRCPVKLVHPAR